MVGFIGGIDQYLGPYRHAGKTEHLRSDVVLTAVERSSAGINPCDYISAIAESGDCRFHLLTYGRRIHEKFRSDLGAHGGEQLRFYSGSDEITGCASDALAAVSPGDHESAV